VGNNATLPVTSATALTVTGPLTVTGGTLLGNVTASNLTASGTASLQSVTATNVTIAGRPAVKQDDAVNVQSVTFNNIYGGVDSTGNAEFSSLDVNGGALKIFANGSVSLNGQFVVDGPNKKLIVYDDEVVPRAHRYQVQDVLSGNIGSTDNIDFGTATLPAAARNNPLSFSSLANAAQKSAVNTLLNRFNSSAFSDIPANFSWMLE
jgi:hypothetical protein